MDDEQALKKLKERRVTKKKTLSEKYFNRLIIYVFFFALLAGKAGYIMYDMNTNKYASHTDKKIFTKPKENPYLTMSREKPKKSKFESAIMQPEKQTSLFSGIIPLEDRPPKKTNPFADIIPLEDRQPKKRTMADDFNNVPKMTMADQIRSETRSANDPRKKQFAMFALSAFVFLPIAFIDFIILLFRNRKHKLKTEEVATMDNKKITKIAILVFVIWGIISFMLAQQGYRSKFKIDMFLVLNIPSILIFGYLWITDKFTLK